MSKNITITKEQQEVIKDYFKVYNKADTSSLKVFEVCLDYFKVNKGVKRATLKANLIQEFKALFDVEVLQNSFVSRLKKIIGIASSYRDFNVKYTNEDGEATLYYKTIEDIIKLLQFISDNTKELGDDVFPKVRKQIEEALDSEAKKVAYNNSIQALITTIKQEYNIKGEQDDLEFKGGYNELWALVHTKLNDEEKQKMIEALQADLKA